MCDDWSRKRSIRVRYRMRVRRMRRNGVSFVFSVHNPFRIAIAKNANADYLLLLYSKSSFYESYRNTGICQLKNKNWVRGINFFFSLIYMRGSAFSVLSILRFMVQQSREKMEVFFTAPLQALIIYLSVCSIEKCLDILFKETEFLLQSYKHEINLDRSNVCV